MKKERLTGPAGLQAGTQAGTQADPKSCGVAASVPVSEGAPLGGFPGRSSRLRPEDRGAFPETHAAGLRPEETKRGGGSNPG